MSEAKTYRTRDGRLVIGNKPRWVAGGYAVDVKRAEDLDIPAMRLTDGTLHPAARKGFGWTEALCNLTEVAPP